ncbi:MAG: DUF4367 domain-containing protein [Clostridia bacterium]|nr:DUF4367 domain-containing protein [Clostridia bacterium]
MNIHESSYDSELYEKSWNWFGEILSAYDSERTASKEISEDERKEADEFLETHSNKYLRSIERYYKREKRNRIIKYIIPKSLRIVAMAVGTVTLIAGIGFATSQSARVFIARLITDVTPEYTTLRYEREKIDTDVPEEWNGTYYPSIIPEGLVFGEVFDSINDHCVTYCAEGSGEVHFSYEEIVHGTVNLDTENAEVQSVEINEMRGEAILKDDHVTIYWMDDDQMMIMFIREHSLESAIEYAEGIRKLQ